MRKRILLISIAIGLLGVGLLARADLRNIGQSPAATDVRPMVLARTVTATDSPAVDSTTATWTGAQTLCKTFPRGCNLVSLSVLALDATDDPASGEVDWKLWLCPKYGPMTLTAYGTWPMGDLEVSHNPETGIAIGTDTDLSDATATHYAWGEEPTVTDEYWIYPVVESGATNGVGRLTFKRGNAAGWMLEITDFAASSTIDKLYIFLETPKPEEF